MSAKSGQFTADKTKKGQFLRGSQRNLAGQKVEKKISSPIRIAGVSYPCNDQGQWAGNVGKGKCCSGFVKQVCRFITRKSSMTGDPLEAQSYTGGEGLNIPEGLWLENCWGCGKEGEGQLVVS